MLDQLVDAISGSPVAYALILGFVVFDAVLPVLPSETALITGGILAAQGDLSLVLVIVAGWAGALAGDNLVYTIGAKPGHRLRDKVVKGEKGRHRLEWAKHQLDERPWIISVANFIPGARSAVAFAAGTVDFPRGRYTGYVAVGGLLWSATHALLGYVGGSTFRDSFWLPLLASLAVAGLVSLAGEAFRRTHLHGPQGAGA